MDLEFVGEPSLIVGMTQQPDLRREPLRSIYDAMTNVLEEAGSAQEQGDILGARLLAEEASILGRAILIVDRSISATSAVEP